MPPREPERSPESLHCDHCGRTVRETQHTRSAYTVDYYSVRGGDGELCSFTGEDGQRGGSYVKLLDPRELTTCAQCYRQPAVQAERDRCFQPERADARIERRNA